MLCSRTAPVDFFLISINSRLQMSMKLKRPALLVSISLLTLAGLYYGLYFPGTGNIPIAAGGLKAPVASSRAAKSVDITPAMDHAISPKHQAPAESEWADAGVREKRAESSAARIAPPQMSNTPPTLIDRKDRRPTDTPAEQETDLGAKQAPAPVGIRLAPDVRLPLAAMPNDLKLNPIKQKALQNIIDDYYQTVAAVVSTPENLDAGTSVNGNAETSVVEENGDETRVITNNPAVESARMRADLRFKALFGDAAYTRMTMNTLLESRLPVIPAKP